MGFAQDRADLRPSLATFTQQSENPDWQARAAAFYSMLDVAVPGGFGGRAWLLPSAFDALFESQATAKDPFAVAVIALLGTENVLRHSRQNPATEEYSNYRADLIAAVAALHDRRAIDGLLDNIATGNLATKGLAALGRDSLDKILEISNNSNPATGDEAGRRMGATRVLAQMLDPTVVKIDDPATRSRIKGGLIHVAGDGQSAVRIAAVDGLARVLDPDITVLLQTIARTDSYKRPGELGQADVYPVREAAQKAPASRPAARH